MIVFFLNNIHLQYSGLGIFFILNRCQLLLRHTCKCLKFMLYLALKMLGSGFKTETFVFF